MRESGIRRAGRCELDENVESCDLSETVETTARQAASSSAAGLSRATGWTADAMNRMRPRPRRVQKDHIGRSRPYSPLSFQWWWRWS